jgi:hypothetical protein
MNGPSLQIGAPAETTWSPIAYASTVVGRVYYAPSDWDRRTITASGAMQVDRDPLTFRELLDLGSAHEDLLEGRFLDVPEDADDEELFRLLDAG